MLGALTALTANSTRSASGRLRPAEPYSATAREALPVAAHDSMRAALRAWAAVLGDAWVRGDDGALGAYARTTGVRGTRPAAVLFPACQAEVVAAVEIAGRFGIPLHPISRGKSWGYGDACAPEEGQAILDLRRMNRIVELDRELATVVLEPGVTQGQLAAYLREHAPELWMDATGAGPDASVVGNTLERGFGHTPYADHFLHTCGLEVVLACGRVLETGFGHYPEARAKRVYPYGLGPVLDGLFSQSNLGVVTRMGLWLMPAPEQFTAFFFRAKDDADLEDVIARLAPLRLRGQLRSAIHIANDLRVISGRTAYPWERTGGAAPLPDSVRAELRRELGVGAWNVCGALYGRRDEVAVGRRALREALGGRYRPVFLTDGRLAWAERIARALGPLGRPLADRLATVRPVYDILKGQPHPGALPGASWRVRGAPRDGLSRDPLDLHAGLIWVSPVVPTTGPAAREVMDLLTPIYTRHGFEPLVTFTMITARAMCCVTNLAFDQREADERARAAACYDELMDALVAAGYLPYRTAPGGARRLAREGSPFWEVVDQLKRALDPQDLLSPGRFAPRRLPTPALEPVGSR